eukprot:TRINITY_DN21088_c0_g1_i1.p1 TRINITY_DN21088_c0_g1~~TRINITY_DN21088_c0_g1_i1.p1  ORF type:complete len:351 (-),score=76.35 TRINITY_DN21088_c0_g1_i1:28-1056(-)
MASETMPSHDLETLKKFRKLPTNEEKDLIAVCDLKVGDVIFVREFNAVAFSQAMTQVFGGDVTKTGKSNSVHCMIVISSNGVTVQVAHVTRDGGAAHFIEDPLRASAFTDAGLEAPSNLSSKGFKGVVYRLQSSKELRVKAAAVASELVESFRISYATTNAIGSVLKNPQVGNYLGDASRTSFVSKGPYLFKKDEDDDRESCFRECLDIFFPCFMRRPQKKRSLAFARLQKTGRIDAIEHFGRMGRLETMDRQLFQAQSADQRSQEESGAPLKLSLFCSEFIIKCYQEALAHTERLLEQSEVRVIDLRGEACSPMTFEGFLAENERVYHDWQKCGKIYAEFS